MVHSHHQNPKFGDLRPMEEESLKQASQEHFTFEEAFTRLEGTVQALENGGLTLDEATGLYEEGMRLARICNELLSSTELRVTRLQASFGEQMRLLGTDGSRKDPDPRVLP